MNSRQFASLDALHLFQSRLDLHSHLLGNLNESVPRQELDTLVARLDRAAVDHEELLIRQKGETSHKNALRAHLLNYHLAPIVSVAEMHCREVTQLTHIEMPPAHAIDVVVGFRAHAIAGTCDGYRDLFVRNGLPTDFAEQLCAAADELIRAGTQRNITHIHRLAVTYGIDYDFRRTSVVVETIKSLARRALTKHPEILEELRQALLHRPRRALSAPRSRRALPSGPPVEGARAARALAPIQQSAPPRRISAWARMVELIRPRDAYDVRRTANGERRTAWRGA